MKYPNLIHVDSVVRIAQQVHIKLPDGRWVPARGEGFQSLWTRFNYAWLVFTGKADALIWEQQ